MPDRLSDELDDSNLRDQVLELEQKVASLESDLEIYDILNKTDHDQALKLGVKPKPKTTTCGSLCREIERLKRGDFTEEEFQNLCHRFDGNDADRFAKGCIDYNRKLFGSKTQLGEIEEMIEERESLSEVMFGMRERLNEVANALKGEPEPLQLHSWHDLGEVAKEEMDKIEYYERLLGVGKYNENTPHE